MACAVDVTRALWGSSSTAPAATKVSSMARVSFFAPGAKPLCASVAAAGQVRRRSPSLVVDMAKREEELVSIRQMSDEDINETVVDLKGELFLLRSKQATRQEYKSSEFRRIRKNIARMLTVRREREIERGIGIRESRKLDREWKRNIVIRPPPSYAASLAEQEKK